MGLYLIASGWLELSLWIAVLKVCVGLGFVIFVHELGHFVVAKTCGVKCEKFYLGFDIGGWKLCKFTRGETEYGIGILPLGGYVKMLGQEDNPARLQEEIERARKKQTGVETADAPPDENSGDKGNKDAGDAKSEQAKQAKGEEIDIKAAEQALYDPRSYLAQSVPKRMAIISAGVIMNLIFAFLMAVVAFTMGVTRIKCAVGGLMPGQGAWQENVQVGDDIGRVGDKRSDKFEDVREAVFLGDRLEDGIPIVIQRGVEEPITKVVKPDRRGMVPLIGISSPWRTALSKKIIAALPGTPAAEATPKFELGDKIVEIEIQGHDLSHPINNPADLHQLLAANPDKVLKVTVERSDDDGSNEDTPEAATPVRLDPIEVAPNPMRRLGLVMAMGEIYSVQAGSPAAEKGIEKGDKIVEISGEQSIDPMTLPERLRRRAGEKVTLKYERDGNTYEVDNLELRSTLSYETPTTMDSPITVPALGIAYHVLNTVDSVVSGSEVATAQNAPRPDSVIVKAKLIPPEEQTSEEQKLEQPKVSIDFDDEENRNWPTMIYTLQRFLPGTEVELTWKSNGQEQTATFQTRPAKDWFNPKRGFFFEPMTFIQVGDTFGEAVRLAADETVHSTLLVYRFLQKLGTGQVSPKALGGPVTIFAMAKMFAEQGTAELLIFLTLLSANLAVINFLPIPLLDGGHMMLLSWEGVRGKPASERVQLILTYIGLIFILTLMIWVIGLDIYRLFS